MIKIAKMSVLVKLMYYFYVTIHLMFSKVGWEALTLGFLGLFIVRTVLDTSCSDVAHFHNLDADMCMVHDPLFVFDHILVALPSVLRVSFMGDLCLVHWQRSHCVFAFLVDMDWRRCSGVWCRRLRVLRTSHVWRTIFLYCPVAYQTTSVCFRFTLKV